MLPSRTTPNLLLRGSSLACVNFKGVHRASMHLLLGVSLLTKCPPRPADIKLHVANTKNI